MGEIADALRRASGIRPLSQRAGAQGQTAPVVGGVPLHPEPAETAEPAERDAGLRRIVEPAPARVIERPDPVDPAIVLEEGPALEACRHVALAVRTQLEARGAHSLAVVSALRDEGKTTTSCNLALALASLSSSRDVALIDLDLRRPSIAQVLSVDSPKGIEDVLKGEASLDEARVQLGQPPLDVYPAMAPQRSAHEMLTRWRLAALFDELERRYALVVVDTPPTLLVPDSRLILERVPQCLPVARAGVSRVRSFRELIAALPRGRVLSTLLNGARPNAQYYQAYDYGSDATPAEGFRGRRGRGRDGRS